MEPTVAVIVSTYNWPEALELCLTSLMRQTRLPDEIIIGDDGSRPDTAAVIDRLCALSPVAIRHVWQEDRGFRLAAIRNKAVIKADAEYIIQIDGDIIAHPRFVEDHLSLACRGHFLRGGRVLLGPRLTACLCATRRMQPIHPWTRGIRKAPNTLRLPRLARFLSTRYRPNAYVLGCNMSYYKSDFLAVNGYDERFEGWGGEDSDFFRRLRLNGVANRRLKFAGIAYHLHHPEASRHNQAFNASYCSRPDPDIYCRDGADKYLICPNRWERKPPACARLGGK